MAKKIAMKVSGGKPKSSSNNIKVKIASHPNTGKLGDVAMLELKRKAKS